MLTTPSARRFTDTGALERQTGHPVRSEYKNPGEPDVLPDPDAVIVAPATVNTINKWAAGICDTLALGILVEAIGKRLPIVALPSTNQAHAAHPAFAENIGKLRSWGVSVLFGAGPTRRASPGGGPGRTVPLVHDPRRPRQAGPAPRGPKTAEPPPPPPRNRPRSARPWTSCRGLWRSWSTTRAGTPTSAGRAPDADDLAGLAAAGASEPRRHPAVGRPDDRGRRRGGDVPGLARRGAYHGPDHPRQWWCVPGAVIRPAGACLPRQFRDISCADGDPWPGGLYGDAG